jgi:hypothetical protein
MSKQEMRRRVASLSFSEKIRILEKLRDPKSFNFGRRSSSRC